MKVATVVLSSACLLCLFLSQADAAPSSEENAPGLTFWDRIFNIPRSVFTSTSEHLNKNGVACKDGKPPVEGPDGKGTCHDNGGLHIARSVIDSVNDLLNGKKSP